MTIRRQLMYVCIGSTSLSVLTCPHFPHFIHFTLRTSIPNGWSIIRSLSLAKLKTDAKRYDNVSDGVTFLSAELYPVSANQT